MTDSADGGHLVDPDLIQPGWKLTIPRTSRVAHDSVEPPEEVEPPRDVGPAIDQPTAQVLPIEPPPTAVTTAPMAEPQPSINSAPQTTADEAEAAVDDQVPGWMLPGLSGAGALLAGGVYFAVRAHRRTQLRYRLPGQTIAPPPKELLSVEKTAFVSGTPHVDALGQLDRVLRQLAASFEAEGQALPTVTSTILARGALTLRLNEPADLPPPWEGEDREWSTTLDDSTPDVDQVAPYPLLVSIGQDTAGRLHLINLEQLRVLALVGDQVAALALARHIAAELALNPWSVLVEVDTVGIGEELAELDRMRLRQHRPGIPVVDQIVADLHKASALNLSDPDPFRVVVTTSSDDAAQLIEILGPATTRLGSAVITLGGAATAPGSVKVELTKEGRLHVPDLGLDLAAAGLTSDEASACAAIVDLTSKSPAIEMPSFTEATDGWRSLADHAGALRDELTDVRSDGPAGERSLLPNETVDYVNVAATVTEDVERLAPIVADEVRLRVEDADPTLDDDVAEWFREGCRLPRLTLLGPVTASAHGAALPVVAKRRPYFVEMLTYLALHPEGRTGNAVADAFSITSSRARTDLGHLRAWLGTNPRTCRPHLPLATDSRVYGQTGVRAFQLEDVLVDVDLFRRLRARGEARGARGIEDLAAALRLVVGLPFDLLRERGWHWLLDDNRLNETIAASIVDTAHVVVLNALANGDVSTARSAAETACQAAPHDDICRLDLIKTAVADGDNDVAHQIFCRDVCNRSDDHLPPIDLPNRTGKVVAGQSWGSDRRAEMRPRGPRP